MLRKINCLPRINCKALRCFSQDTIVTEKTTRQVVASNQLGRIALNSYLQSINIWNPTLADPKFRVKTYFL